MFAALVSVTLFGRNMAYGTLLWKNILSKGLS